MKNAGSQQKIARESSAVVMVIAVVLDLDSSFVIIVIVEIGAIEFGRAIIDQLFQFLARFEIRDTLGRNIDWISGFGVPAATRVALPNPKGTKSAQFNLLSTVQGLDDVFKDLFDDNFRVFFG